LWNAASGQELKHSQGHSYFVSSVAFSPDGKTLASGSDAGAIKLWVFSFGRGSKNISRSFKSLWNPSRNVLMEKTNCERSWDNTIKLWTRLPDSELKTLEAHSWYVDSVAFSPEGKTLAAEVMTL